MQNLAENAEIAEKINALISLDKSKFPAKSPGDFPPDLKNPRAGFRPAVFRHPTKWPKTAVVVPLTMGAKREHGGVIRNHRENKKHQACIVSSCVLRTQSMAMILASFAAMRFSSSRFIDQE